MASAEEASHGLHDRRSVRHHTCSEWMLRDEPKEWRSHLDPGRDAVGDRDRLHDLH
jgi:hypothetical protein